MRLVFPNVLRPKKSAKIIARRLGVPLSKAQRAVARICEFEDWYDFEKNHANGTIFPLDQDLEYSNFVHRQTSLIQRLSIELDVPDGDAQYALADARLTGDRPVLLSDQIDIRIGCWRQTSLPTSSNRARGAVGKLKSPGRNGEVVILRKFDRPTTIVTHKDVGMVADFEYKSPAKILPLFLPFRLYLPYGYWLEEDGAKVLFSRDYKPMWRIREGSSPQRLEPSLRIVWRDQSWFWDDDHAPWASKETRLAIEAELVRVGIQTLPVSADALPIAVHNDNLMKLSGAIDQLVELRRLRDVE
ncbi:MAG: hypothetical protein KIT16_16075 [Rhodospirillaceae bacterium]|nr:hypothetical protein [Rhodospirillaceae bacterium]